MSLHPRIVLLSGLLALAGCASTADTSHPGHGLTGDVAEATRTESNGDVITEYRIGGQLRAVMVVPSRGPRYYLFDRDGDGVMDKTGDNPPQTYFKLFGW